MEGLAGLCVAVPCNNNNMYIYELRFINIIIKLMEKFKQLPADWDPKSSF